MIKYEIMTANEVGRKFRSDYPVKDTGVPFFDTDDLDRAFYNQDDRRGMYIVALKEDNPISMLKFYMWKDQESSLKKQMEKMGIPFKGNLYLTSYIGTVDEFRRKGVATKLKDLFMGLIKVGDIVKTSSHEPEGKLLNTNWARKNKSKYNFMFGDWYEALPQYDSSKKNFWIQDFSLKLASRPIPINKTQAMQFAKKFVEQLPKKLEKFYKHPKSKTSQPLLHQKGFNPNTWEWNVGYFKEKTVTGNTVAIPVNIIAKAPKSWGRKYVSGGSVTSRYYDGPKKRGTPILLTLAINPNVSLDEFKANKSRFLKEAYSVLIHEMTHAMDFLRLDYRGEEAADKDPSAYYNSPSEVRAYLQQVVDEVLESTKKDVIKTKGWGNYLSSEHIWNTLFRSSSTWARIKEHLTERNKNKILKAIARSLSDHVPKWLDKYGDPMLKNAGKVIPFRAKSKGKKPLTFPIAGKRYIKSPYSGFAGLTGRPSFLWAYDTDKNILGMWRLSDGDNKFDNRIGPKEEKIIFALENRGELNRVSTSEYNKINRAMTKRSREYLKQLQEEMREQESQAEKNFRWVAEEYFKRTIVPFFHDTYARYKGTHPIAFEYRERNPSSKKQQLARWVMDKVLQKYWDEDKILSYAKLLKRTSLNPISLEGLGMQDPYFIMNDVLPDMEEEFFRRVKLAAFKKPLQYHATRTEKHNKSYSRKRSKKR